MLPGRPETGMQIDIVIENAYARKVNVVVPVDTVKGALDRALRDFGTRAKVPGFRPGKVPRQVVEARYGASLANDVAEDLIQRAWTNILTTKGLEPVGRPSLLDRGDVRAKDGFKFTIGVEVRPEITAKNYTGLEVNWPAFVVEEAEIDQALEIQRQRQARLVAVDDRPVKAGDTVQVEVEAKDGDVVVLSEPGTLVRTSGDAWLPGLGNLLIGAAIEETRTGTIAFSAEARNEAVAGKELAVTAKVLSIQAMQAPELNAEYAKEQGHDSVKALKAATKAQLVSGREEGAKNQARANLLEALVAANPFDVPQGMIEQNLSMLMEEVKLQQAYRGVDPKSVRFTDAQVADLRIRAAFAARGGLLLEAVGKTESITATDADVEARIAEIAAERSQSVETVRGWFERDGGVSELKDRILEEKTIDWMLERAKVTHGTAEAAAPAKKAPAKKAAKKEEAEAAPAEAVEAAPVEEAAPAKKAPAKKAAAKKEAAVEAAPAEAAPAEEAAAAPKKKAPAKKKSEG